MAKLRELNTYGNLRERKKQHTWVPQSVLKTVSLPVSQTSPISSLILHAQWPVLVMWCMFKAETYMHFFVLFLDRCKWVWSLPAGPRREAVHPRVCECPRLVPLLLPQRLQVAPRWAELWGWVTRGNRGQRLIHRALAANVAGYVAPEWNTCDLERWGAFSSGGFSFCRSVCQTTFICTLEA